MKTWNVILAILLVSGLVGSFGCAPKPTAPVREKTDIVIYGATAGGAAYIISVGLAEIISKHHPWLRASAMETFGSSDNVKKMENDPKAFGIVSDNTYWLALEGAKPFDKKYTNLRVVGLNQICTYSILALNPKIKTKADLVGKKIAWGKRGSSIADCSDFLLGNVWNMVDKVKPEYLGWKEGAEALKDGLIDAMLVVIVVAADDAGNAVWADHPSFAELIALQNVYFIGPTEAELTAAAKQKGWPVSYFHIPPKALGPRQPEGADTISIMNTYLADASMSAEVAYEIMKVQYDYHKQWGTYHPAAKIITPKTLGYAPVKTEADFHPGALKFLKEKNVPLYIGGKAPPLK